MARFAATLPSIGDDAIPMDGMVPAREDGGQSTSEDALVRALRGGDPQAFEALVRDYGGRLLRVARRLLGSEDDARDVVQETFLQAWRNVATFEGRSTLATWLTRIAVNAALMRLRKRKRRDEASIDDLMPSFDSDGCRTEPLWQIDASAEDMLARDQVRTQVLEAIDRLPEPHRTILILRDIEELNTAETAALLDISEGAVKTRLHRARAALKKLLEPMFERGTP